ncbi:hypothetical protein EVAR_61302_1 [Eumeta japonica]|uniref:Uncharacterized protein n=1 Tax=Eumeta variegata TaxID=151549 RepID=A0A4C1XKP2_EUMVA|nr:hypothetical protein EVAR_61302_1 [Eumeta japonica]
MAAIRHTTTRVSCLGTWVNFARARASKKVHRKFRSLRYGFNVGLGNYLITGAFLRPHPPDKGDDCKVNQRAFSTYKKPGEPKVVIQARKTHES